MTKYTSKLSYLFTSLSVVAAATYTVHMVSLEADIRSSHFLSDKNLYLDLSLEDQIVRKTASYGQPILLNLSPRRVAQPSMLKNKIIKQEVNTILSSVATVKPYRSKYIQGSYQLQEVLFEGKRYVAEDDEIQSSNSILRGELSGSIQIDIDESERKTRVSLEGISLGYQSETVFSMPRHEQELQAASKSSHSYLSIDHEGQKRTFQLLKTGKDLLYFRPTSGPYSTATFIFKDGPIQRARVEETRSFQRAGIKRIRRRNDRNENVSVDNFAKNENVISGSYDEVEDEYSEEAIDNNNSYVF